MDDLLKRRIGNDNKKKKKEPVTVSYSLSGYAIKGKLAKWKQVCISFLIIVCLLIVFIYIPPMFYKEKNVNTYIPITPNATAIKEYQTYLKDHPDDDFDNDGLNNALENEYGTDVWSIDTDWDGVSDYAELFITETSPTDASTIMVKQMSTNDEKNGDTLGTPYKIDDIIFWPDTYQAKSYGAVVRTLAGYRFCNYKGWVRFPETVYAYGYKDGVHYELKYRSNEDAWKIETDDEIVLYSEPLTFVHRLELPFVDDIYLEDTGFGQFLSDILPHEGGFVRCSKIASVDAKESEAGTVEAPLNLPYLDRTDVSRFAQNTNTLKDLSKVRKLIEAGECVAVSMYSGNAGEAIGIIYGYDEDGNLLVADEKLKPVGKIEITEYAIRMMDKEGTIGQTSWFEWSGLGFDSAYYGDRINFFASTITGVDDNGGIEINNVEVETEEIAETESVTEVLTESETDDEMMVDVSQQEIPDVDNVLESEMQTETDPIVPETEAITEKRDTVITFGF